MTRPSSNDDAPRAGAALSRRDVGRAFLSVALLLGLPSTTACSDAQDPVALDTFDWLFRGNRERAIRIGKAYLDAYGEPIAPGELPVVAESAARILLEEPTLEAAATAFDLAITDDFALRDVVVVEGWVLARHEASLCALAYAESRRA